MKTSAVAAAALACASSAFAQTGQYFNLVASAPGSPIDGEPLKPLGRYWHIGVESNSSCGDATPAVHLIDEAMAVYNDGTSHQQFGFVDISGAADGLLALTPAGSPGVAPAGPFALMGAEQNEIYLYYGGAEGLDSQWLACPDVAEGEYWVYPEAAYGKAVGKDECTVFQVKAQEIEHPTETCIFY
ncbi:hypothetical protein KVR01_012352 [Diaporthe batatas]|uniref:uncharacterized protein n=1 Tax=Diaporthe batatas TaxID=748121 RepID=UPI001D03BC71|nr:uncharacterized protein KVR01_012352 [Diaporthe batatas]KAG8157690.1 hypothetical protein KVR01_012352 [Diaporthe batatas]